ncbi:60 kDa lysophospholipase isoform X4 [Astyanax mexicanus]|uniref:60 kDa lysophospholipase isoform X1 n=1 Tax=Astyanax mexicanus TaxID=7994 RepID=UPI0020CAD9CD|nr:60 kDa lysophospholipase isoform X1 [Astyanax mexicanus]XP_049332386.1 60 kDa lysophospholipase isoform X2 [Astyanax mexicanus]XP_049332387.1 60 kDa lysophospholipase isoform X3 [Astyanax mexicanus]XP_049332388.1 60 kDa lysophospholipase isoform X4 [Astyanax mexicanus]
MTSDRKIYVLYTGGTFGMKKDTSGKLVPQSLETIREFFIHHTVLYERKPGETEEEVLPRIVTPDGFIVLYHQLADDDPNTPPEGKECKILYKFESMPTPIDSSNVTPKDWSDMAKKIQNNMEAYNGFVVIHGTDTMAYTSSALSFILGEIKKPVIITGAQMPIFHPRTDGVDNFVGSMLMAGYFSDTPSLQQVMLYDMNKLFQGNRVVKFDCDSFSVFDSPDVYPLASLETTIKLITSKIELKKMEPKTTCTVKRMFTFDGIPQVKILRFFPGITEDYVRSVLEGAAGVIVETYGSGNVPESNWLFKLLMDADKRKVLMLNCTQVYRGTVLPIYGSSGLLQQSNVIPGYDITPEAAITKMVWVLNSELDHQKRREILEHSVYGESRAPPMKLIVNPE